MKPIFRTLSLAFVVALPALALAGYGGMHEVESDWSDISLGDMAIGALVIGGIIALWKKFFE